MNATLSPPTAADAAVTATTRILAGLSDGYPGNFNVRLWNGQNWQPGTGTARFTVVLKHPGALRAMFRPVKAAVAFGEAYIFDDFDIEGDIVAFTEWLRHLVERGERRGIRDKLRLYRSLKKLPDQPRPRDASQAGDPTRGDHSIARDRQAVEYTYNVPGEVYQLFLDKNLQYTCGYFAHPDEDLDVAQERKMDYICRKLRLKPGERFVDFGCGWGGLLIHAARNYGVEAVGVTLSEAQVKWAEREIAAAGLSDRVRVELADYREFHAPGAFDKAASVGMGEHVGHKQLPTFLSKIYECLRPGGAYLHHTINLRPGARPPRWTGFSHKYVFPNGEMQSPVFVLSTAGGAGFEIRDLENLREHYVYTLENWVRRLEANRERVIELAGDVRYRIFRLYMAGATLGFRSGVYNLTQSLVVKPDAGRAGLPLTRADWYA
ncbi:MAG TPA: cyclopropane-fatty-acyl-phospholipid synthase family protein [Lacipirellulaceae bacterium]